MRLIQVSLWIFIFANIGLAETWTALDYPGAVSTYAYGIDGNNVVGSYSLTGSDRHGFLYCNGNWKTLDFSNLTHLSGISGNLIVGYDERQLFGFLYNLGNQQWSFLSVPGQTPVQPLGIGGTNIVGLWNGWEGFLDDISNYQNIWTSLNIGTATAATGINGNNIVGYYTTGGTFPSIHGFICYNIYAMSKFILDCPTGTLMLPYGIQGKTVVGGGSDAFIYDMNSGRWTLFDYPGANRTVAQGISGNSIVGCYTDSSGNYHGFIYAWSGLCSYKLAGDLNNDCRVDFSDIALLGGQWLKTCDNSTWCNGYDVGQNGIIDFRDLQVSLADWLVDCGLMLGSKACIPQ